MDCTASCGLIEMCVWEIALCLSCWLLDDDNDGLALLPACRRSYYSLLTTMNLQVKPKKDNSQLIRWMHDSCGVTVKKKEPENGKTIFFWKQMASRLAVWCLLDGFFLKCYNLHRR